MQTRPAFPREEMISRYLGFEFEFDAKTSLRRESNGMDRIVAIGDFIEDSGCVAGAPLRTCVCRRGADEGFLMGVY